MRIVVTGTRGIPHIQGGVETHCQELYPHIVTAGHEVILIRRSCYVTPENKIPSYKGVKLLDIYAPRKKSLEAIVHSFLAVIKAKRLKADILHIHAIGPSLVVPFARLLGLKVVMTHHGTDYDRQKWGKIARFSLKSGEKWGVTYANEVIVISTVINEIIQKKYHRMDAHLIFNGVPEPVRISSSAYIESLGLQKEKYIFAMGRFVPEKGFDLLVKAFSEIKDNPFRLVIAGDADHEDTYSKELKKLAQEHHVVLTGFISGAGLQELLTHAHSFVLPSYHEGLPISLLEAMSYNLDVLVSDIPANLAVNLPQENYFKTGEAKELSAKLKTKISRGKQNISYNMKPYYWENISQQILDVYKKATSNHNIQSF